MRAALEAERIAGDVLLPPDIYFVRARQLIREVLRQSGITGEIDALVAEVVPI
jgi:hypothetical protein